MKYYALTSPGGRRNNEDCIRISCLEPGNCFVLADGLGGHGKGELASTLIADHIIEQFQQAFYQRKGTKETLIQCFDCSQERLLQYQEECGCKGDMKTTAVVLLRIQEEWRFAHVGDSRLYFFQENHLVGRTFDHSVPQMLVSAGEIREKEIRGHEDRNRLIRVMGTPWQKPAYDLSESIKVSAGQAFLLCSDGFWEWIDEKRMLFHLRKSKTPEEWLLNMEKEILHNGSGKEMDNYSAIGIFHEVEETKRHFLNSFFGKVR